MNILVYTFGLLILSSLLSKFYCLLLLFFSKCDQLELLPSVIYILMTVLIYAFGLFILSSSAHYYIDYMLIINFTFSDHSPSVM